MTISEKYIKLSNHPSIYNEGVKIFTKEVFDDLVLIWKNETLLQVYSSEKELIFNSEGIEYFIHNLARLDPLDYIPSSEDVLRCSIKTSGVKDNDFVIDGNPVILFDAGGLHSERKKWVHCKKV